MSILAPAPSHVKPIILFSDSEFSDFCRAQCDLEPSDVAETFHPHP